MHPHHAAVGLAPVQVSESIVIDVETGQVLNQLNADAIGVVTLANSPRTAA